MRDLNNNTDRFSELVKVLREKLAPVSRPNSKSNPVTASAPVPQPPIAPVAAILRTENERLEKNLNELSEIIDFLEV